MFGIPLHFSGPAPGFPATVVCWGSLGFCKDSRDNAACNRGYQIMKEYWTECLANSRLMHVM